MTDEQPKTLLTALLAVQRELPNISLEKKGKGQIGSRDYKYLDLAGLHDKILPLLNRHGLVWTTAPSHEDGAPVLHYALRLATDGVTDARIGGTMPLMLDKQNSQGLGSAITYARRYSLLSVIGAVGDSDDDGAKASIPRSEQPTEQIRPQTRKGDEAHRLLTDEEKALVIDAINKWAKAGGEGADLLYASVGCDDLDSLTVSQGRAIMKKVGVPSK